jgi:hypothetical protein
MAIAHGVIAAMHAIMAGCQALSKAISTTATARLTTRDVRELKSLRRELIVVRACLLADVTRSKYRCTTSPGTRETRVCPCAMEDARRASDYARGCGGPMEKGRRCGAIRLAARAGRSRNCGTHAEDSCHAPLTAVATPAGDPEVQAQTLQQLGVAGTWDVPGCCGAWSMPCDIDCMHGGIALMQTIMIGCQAANTAITAVAVDARKTRDAGLRMIRNFTSGRWCVKTAPTPLRAVLSPRSRPIQVLRGLRCIPVLAVSHSFLSR